MNIRLVIIIICTVLTVSSCYLPINGKVIDAETQQPIDGAIVLVEWTKKHGFGDAWTESYKVVEAVSDKDGTVNVGGCYSPFVEKPDVTVYKKGYVAWSSRWIFPGYENRTDFRWTDYVFKLERFKTEYSHDAHTGFIDSCINASLKNNYEFKKPIFNAIEWEQDLAFQERLRKKKQ